MGVAIGDQIVDLAALQAAGLLDVPAPADVFSRDTLNDFIALGRDAWRSVRVQLSALLARGTATLRDDAALRASARWCARPTRIASAGRDSRLHGLLFVEGARDQRRRDVPRSEECVAAELAGDSDRLQRTRVVGGGERHAGAPAQWPDKLPDQERPVFGACRKLDIELEMGFIIGAGNALGEPIACEEAEAHIFGMVLLNDWSARDIQQWEYVPLGPFNSKGFATTISPWIVTLDALEPFRVAQPVQEPQPLAYLRHDGEHAFDIHLEVTCARKRARREHDLADQLQAHVLDDGAATRASHGIRLQYAGGRSDGLGHDQRPHEDSYGSLLELTWNGKKPLQLNEGGTRTFIEDGDELTLAGWCQGDGYRVGFGACVGEILPAQR